jgi:PTH1 family peptidyl-tRNA hydrolase
MDATPWLIVGLGNPGPRYARTRHNIGFAALEAFASAQWPAHLGAPSWTEKWKGLTATLSCGGQRCVLLQPQTYMNRSGASVVPAAQFHRVPPGQIDRRPRRDRLPARSPGDQEGRRSRGAQWPA